MRHNVPRKQCECGALLPEFAEVCLACGSSNLIPVTDHASPFDSDEIPRELIGTAREMRGNRGLRNEE